MNKWQFALGALLVIFMQPRGANAAVTASLSIVGPNPYVGSCPTNIAFTGSVSGTPGTKVTISFNRFINGVQKVVTPNPTVTLTGSPYAVNDSIPISAMTGAATFDQIWVHNISGGQSDVYSNKVNFSVNCGLVIPPGGLHFVNLPPTPSTPFQAPDLTTCSNHAGLGGGLACSALWGKSLPLVWDCNNCKVDGYHVYRVDGGQHTLVPSNGAYSTDPTVTLALLDDPGGGFSGKCYVVRAHVGNAESLDSNRFCASGALGGTIVESFDLGATAVRAVDHHFHYEQSGPGCGLPNPGTQTRNGLWVGFIHHYDSSAGFTCSEDTFVDQTAVGFDLGTAGIILRDAKATVQSATLTFQRLDGTNASCLGGIHLPTGDWSGATDLIPNNDFISGIPWSGNGVDVNTGAVRITGSNVTVDVTGQVNNWTKGGQPNHGFLLIGGNEDTSGFTNNAQCESRYGVFSLNIKVAINP